MTVIGLTGGSGSGKTAIASLLQKKGIDIIDADIIAREIVKKGEPALDEIVEEFGGDILLSSGELDRKKLGSIVFTNKEKLKNLNKITHKYITKIIMQNLSEHASEIVVIDAALLKESGLIDICDYVIFVTANTDVRIKRIIERDKLDKKAALDRIQSQDADENYLRYADFVVDNSGEKSLDEIAEDICHKIGGIV